jgi:hypothetical protein
MYSIFMGLEIAESTPFGFVRKVPTTDDWRNAYQLQVASFVQRPHFYSVEVLYIVFFICLTTNTNIQKVYESTKYLLG